MRNGLHGLTQRAHFADGHSYDQHAGKVFRGIYARVAADVAAAAAESGVVLDAGCGSGRLATQIAQKRPDLRVHGVDLEQGMVDVATTNAEHENVAVAFTVADLADLPLPDDSVDLIVSTASMHHWTDVSGVVRSLTRVLRPGGQLWIYDMRWVPAGKLRSAASVRGLDVEQSPIRTGRFPVALFKRLAVEPR